MAMRLVDIPLTRKALVGDVDLSDGRRLRQVPAAIFNPDTAQIMFRWFGPKGLKVLVSVDDTPHGELLHVSVSYPGRLPSWKDMRLIRAAFFDPQRDVMMVLPREEDYVNVHEFCFHLQEIPEKWGLR